MVDSVTTTDFPFHCQPDCSIYNHRSDHKERLNFALLDSFIEFKTASHQDPFLCQQGNNKTESNPLMSTTSAAHRVAGQIISYATMLLGAQYHTHAFSVLIVEDHARLIRWDCSSAIVTEPINYNTEQIGRAHV